MAGLPDTDGLRLAVFEFLDDLQQRVGPYVRRRDVNTFAFEGRPLRLMEQGGITKPAGWSQALAIISTSAPVHAGGYEDEDRDDARYYRYMRTAASQARAMNASLDRAAETGRPLVYFISVGDSLYEPVYPVFVTGIEDGGVLVSEQPAHGEYAAAVDLRKYTRRNVRVRLHQREFRARVLYAYADRCCVCRFQHRNLLDAAHIVDDAHEAGYAVVRNGLSMCRIHHGAYDEFLMGIDPTGTIEVHEAVRRERDGPMLLHGLQEMHGERIAPPRRKGDAPDPANLAWKFDQFRERAS